MIIDDADDDICFFFRDLDVNTFANANSNTYVNAATLNKKDIHKRTNRLTTRAENAASYCDTKRTLSAGYVSGIANPGQPARPA